MTRGQRTTILMGMLLLLIMAIYPPYKMVVIKTPAMIEFFTGYGLLWAEALPRSIHYDRLMAQFMLCSLLTAGTVLLQAKPRQ